MSGVRALFACGLVALLAGGAHPALAQGLGPDRPLRGFGSDRPFRGLFGNASDANARHKLDARMSLAAAYDSDVPGTAQIAGLIGVEAMGHTGLLTTGVEYGYRGRRVQVDVATTSGLRYYPALDRIRSISHAGWVAVAALLPGRNVVTIDQTAAYTPSYLYALFPSLDTAPGEAPPAAPDYAVNGGESYSYGSAVRFAYNETGRNSLSATAERQQTEVHLAGGMRQDLAIQGMTGQYSRRFGRNTTANARYRFRTGDVAQDAFGTTRSTLSEHGPDIGGEYRWPLSATRYVRVEGRIGAAALVLPQATKALSVRHEPYRVLGDLSVEYRFRRTWLARGAYRGSVEYVAGLADPVSTDGVTANVDGWLARRIELLASAAYSNGESTWNPSSVRFDTYTGNVLLRYMLTRVLGAHVEYVYYFYDFRGTTLLGPGVPQRLERSGVRAGFTAQLPVLRNR